MPLGDIFGTLYGDKKKSSQSYVPPPETKTNYGGAGYKEPIQPPPEQLAIGAKWEESIPPPESIHPPPLFEPPPEQGLGDIYSKVIEDEPLPAANGGTTTDTPVFKPIDISAFTKGWNLSGLGSSGGGGKSGLGDIYGKVIEDEPPPEQQAIGAKWEESIPPPESIHPPPLFEPPPEQGLGDIFSNVIEDEPLPAANGGTTTDVPPPEPLPESIHPPPLFEPPPEQGLGDIFSNVIEGQPLPAANGGTTTDVPPQQGLGDIYGKVIEGQPLPSANGGTTTDVPPDALGTPEIIDPNAPTPYDQMFQDIMAQHGEGWQNQEDIARAQAASEQRRAAEMSAGMGAAVGGGTFASGMAQAGLKGQEMMMQARQEHDLRGLELQMTHLINQLKVAEASKDREHQKHIQNLINNTALEIEAFRANLYPGAPESVSGSGDGGRIEPGDPGFDPNNPWWENEPTGQSWGSHIKEGLGKVGDFLNPFS